MILVLNTGSSSVKVALFDGQAKGIAQGMVSGIGGAGQLRLGEQRSEVRTADHAHAIDLMLAALAESGHSMADFGAVAHRVVHGGEGLRAPCRVTPQTRAQIAAAVPLAPLHNPPALAGIDAFAIRNPALPQFGSFDTAFHAGQPKVATTYALPAQLRARGIRRYGFHGLSYASLVATLGDSLPERLLAFHLGAGVSLCAIHNGKSVATSMGYSPLSGPTMATRAGDIDAAAVLRLAAEDGIAATESNLNHRSGLLGLSGISGDMQTLLADPSPDAAFAIDHFCYWIARQAGSLIAAMGGVDGFAFTGGIGENSALIRDRIIGHLSWLGPKPVHVVPAQEERQIARDALSILAGQA